MKEFIKVSGISIIIAAILFIIDMLFQYSSGKEVVYDFYLVKKFGYFVMYSLPLTFVNSYFFDFLHHKTKNTLFIKNKIVFGFIGSIILTLAAMFLVRLFHRTILDGLTYSQFIQSEGLQHYITTLLITFTASLFFHAFFFYQALQKNKVKEQKIIAGTASAKFDALKNQLDPHFLFNSLNVLASLIDENPESAQKFTTSLSKVYRYVLEQKSKVLVTVDEELEFAKIYMSLLKMRFEDSIIFDIPERAIYPESKVVPLALQLLLENAVKHNIVNTNKPLHIKIYELDGNLVVENNLQPKQIVKKSSGVGLSNIKQRYQLLTNKKVIINNKANSFAVAIPMLTQQVKIMRTQSTSQINDGYVRARKHVEELKEFYYSLISYFFVIPFLIFINYQTSWDFKWFWFPLFGWALGLVFHAYRVFVNNGVLGRSWEKRKMDEFMQEEENQSWK